MACRRRPPSQTWRTFLTNHIGQIVAADFFVVPTVSYRFAKVGRYRLRVLQDDFSFLAYPTNYLESQPPDRGTKNGRREGFQMNGDRAGRGTVQRPVSEFRIVMAGATGLEPGPTA